MPSLELHVDRLLARGRETFAGAQARVALELSPRAFAASAQRLRKKRLLASPRRDFFLILRPEDRIAGAPDPVRWIAPLLRQLRLDYRVSLLRAAAFHGSSHQASMVFQVIVPRQLRSFDAGRHRIRFLYQRPDVFAAVNQAEWLTQIKSGAGFAQAAGMELTLLDSIRYFHKAAGIDGAARIVRDLGAKAGARKLSRAAAYYDNSAVRRLGYLLDRFGYAKQARALLPFARKAKSMKPLDPSVRSLLRTAAAPVCHKWMLILNRSVEIDE